MIDVLRISLSPIDSFLLPNNPELRRFVVTRSGIGIDQLGPIHLFVIDMQSGVHGRAHVIICASNASLTSGSLLKDNLPGLSKQMSDLDLFLSLLMLLCWSFSFLVDHVICLPMRHPDLPFPKPNLFSMTLTISFQSAMAPLPVSPQASSFSTGRITCTHPPFSIPQSPSNVLTCCLVTG